MRSTGHNEQDYRTIDGNYAKCVRAYCSRYHGYLTDKQMRTHKCNQKHGGACRRLQDMKGRSVRKVKQDSFYDKIIDRMDKLITAVNKLNRTLEQVGKIEPVKTSPPQVNLDVDQETAKEVSEFLRDWADGKVHLMPSKVILDE